MKIAAKIEIVALHVIPYFFPMDLKYRLGLGQINIAVEYKIL